MKQMFQAEEGKLFDTAAACEAYEGQNKLLHFVSNHIGGTYNHDAGFSIIEDSDVVNFINAHIDELIKIVKGGTVVTGAADEGWGWISNEGNDIGDYPDGVSGSTLVEIKYRNGRKDHGYANNWCLSWCSTDDDPLDIVAYRVVK